MAMPYSRHSSASGLRVKDKRSVEMHGMTYTRVVITNEGHGYVRQMACRYTYRTG